MSKYKLGDKFIVISSDMSSLKVEDILEFRHQYATDSSMFVATEWHINDDLT